MNREVDLTAQQAREIAHRLVSDKVIRFINGRESIITDDATKLLADVIYEYETRACDNCLHRDSIGICRNHKSIAFDSDTTQYEEYGCNKFMRVQS